MKQNRLNAFVMCVALGVGVGVSAYAQGRGGPPQNLQVLPKDWTGQQVQQLMRTFTAGLGVECSHCHVGTPQERMKDDKPEKLEARKMLKMMMAINTDFLKDVGGPAAAGTSKVTCYTCHRGALKPLTAPPGGGMAGQRSEVRGQR